MLVPFLIMLREGIEASLIVGIIAGYLSRTGRSAWMPVVWLGVLLAVALALFAGAALQLVSAEFPQKAQELFEAVVGLIAVVILCSMVFWMRKASRSIKSGLQHAIDNAFASSRGQAWALIGMVFLAVAREGLESVFFLLAVFQQSSGAEAPVGALLGILLAAGLGYGIYLGGVKLNLRRFFRWTGAFVLVVAAGILATCVRALHEAGIWNGLQQTAFDLSGILPADSPVGTVLAGVFGYADAPTVGEAMAYFVFLAVSLVLFLKPEGSPAARPQPMPGGGAAKGASS
jgi:high-affinity iron transporter